MYDSTAFYKGTCSLSKKLSESIKETGQIKTATQHQLLSIVDDVLVVWCKEYACLYSQIFQSSVHRDDDEEAKVQTLILSRPPIWEVKCIVTNQSCSSVLLVGDKGLGVVELPRRWGNPSLYEGGNDVITCKVDYIGEQFLACASKVSIVSASWYPGSLDNSHIIMLSSDNYLRIYSNSSLNIPVKAYAVAKGRGSSHSKLGGDVMMGEVAVAFDIGPPPFTKESLQSVNLQRYTDIIDEAAELKKRHCNLEWPVFILYSNGDVYYLMTSLGKKPGPSSLYGPLAMLPNSFDNYGLEFHSLLVLQSSPLVLVIGNIKGYLHHCIVMEKSKDEQDDSSGEIDDLVNSVSQLNLETPQFVLHVYETVHLDFSIPTNENCFLYPMLQTDPNSPSRYWVYHKDGVYLISVPLIDKLIQYANTSEDYLFPDRDMECQIEHFVYTQTFSSVDCAPVIGLTISYAPPKVFILLATGTIAALPMPSLFVPQVTQTLGVSTHATCQENKESFDTHVRSILKRSISQPLLISGSNQVVNLQEYMKLIKHVQDTLRSNYILPQIKAKEEIQRRKIILLEQKRHLQSEVVTLLNEKQILSDKAHTIAERYEEANDRHTQLVTRIEKVMNNFVRGHPNLSLSEIAMQKELEELVDKAQTFSSDLSQINAKHQWHTSQKSKLETTEAFLAKQSSSLSENQLTCLKVTLQKESEKLATLVKKVKNIENYIGV